MEKFRVYGTHLLGSCQNVTEARYNTMTPVQIDTTGSNTLVSYSACFTSSKSPKVYGSKKNLGKICWFSTCMYYAIATNHPFIHRKWGTWCGINLKWSKKTWIFINVVRWIGMLYF